MVRINVVGDFVSSELKGLSFGEELSKLLNEADINVCNLEAPVIDDKAKPIEKSGPSLHQDAKVPEFLQSNGFNVFCLANNHIMDYGENALKQTLSRTKGITTVGAGSFEEAYNIKILEINGKSVGFLNVVQYEFGVIENEMFSNQQIGSAWMCQPIVDEKIVKAHELCDYLIVIPHAGLEMFDLPLPEIRTLYRHFVALGADAVIGGHPHVAQCWENYKGKPIVYSLGNFCFDIKHDDNRWFQGLIASLSFDMDNVNMDIKTIHYNRIERVVEICPNTKLNEHLSLLNSIFNDEKQYISHVNNYCLSLESYYDMLYEMSGYYKVSIRKCLGVIKRILLNKEPKHIEAHKINNIRCETHRWVQSRIYNLKRKQSK